MQTNIIREKDTHKHSIKSYRFKVFEGESALNHIISETQNHEEETEPNTHEEELEEQILEPTQEAPRENVLNEQVQTAPAPAPVESEMLEKLLKKVDELTGKLIKAEMQAEQKEEEHSQMLQSAIEEAKEEGRQIGMQEAIKSNEEKLSDHVNQYNRSLGLLQEEMQKFSDFVEKNTEELASTALQIAKEVILSEISQKGSKIASDLASGLLKELGEYNKVSIKVNPKDYEALHEEYKNDEKISIKSDEAISQGGVIISSDVGNVEASLEERLEKIKLLMEE